MRAARSATSGTPPAVTVRSGNGSHSCVQSSIGTETKAGPFGGREAVWIARASAAGTSCARGGS